MKSYLGMTHKMNQYSTFYSTYTYIYTPTYHKAGTIFSATVNMGCLHFRESIFNAIVFSLRPNFADITHGVYFQYNPSSSLEITWGMVD